MSKTAYVQHLPEVGPSLIREADKVEKLIAATEASLAELDQRVRLRWSRAEIREAKAAAKAAKAATATTQGANK